MNIFGSPRRMMVINRKLLALAVTVLLLAMPVVAAAAESVAILVASRGNVTVDTNGTAKALDQGASIFIGDQIITAPKSFAVLQFVDGAKVTVRPDTVLLVKEYAYNGSDQDIATLSLVKGGLRVITGAMAKSNPENYKVETPVALMGVRGTEFSIMLCDGQICDGTTETEGS